MNADMDLGRALVADPRWKWAAGMRAVGAYPGYPVRVIQCGENVQDTDDMAAMGDHLPWQQPEPYGDHIYLGPYVPDLDDPATAGVVVGMLRGLPGVTRVAIDLHDDCGIFVGGPAGSHIGGTYEDTSLGRAAARAWLSIKERA